MRRDIYLSLGIAFACSAGEAGIRSNFIIAAVYTLLSILNAVIRPVFESNREDILKYNREILELEFEEC